MQMTAVAPRPDLRTSETTPPASPSSPLLTLEGWAQLLMRTPAGLRASLHSPTDFGQALRATRVKLGRRVYFRRDLIEKMIVESTGL